MVPPWVTASHFLSGNREAELKPTTSTATFPCFLIFPLLRPPSDIVPLIAACWGYSLIIIFLFYMFLRSLGSSPFSDFPLLLLHPTTLKQYRALSVACWGFDSFPEHCIHIQLSQFSTHLQLAITTPYLFSYFISCNTIHTLITQWPEMY